MKVWTWEKENPPSITHSISTAVAATVSVIIARLVHTPEAYWAAIATLVVMQSTLGATLTLDRADCRYCRGCVSWSTRGKLLRRKSGCIRASDLSRGIAVDRVSFGEDRISLCEHYPHYHCSNSALGRASDDRFAQIHRSLSRHHRCSRGGGGVARTSTTFSP